MVDNYSSHFLDTGFFVKFSDCLDEIRKGPGCRFTKVLRAPFSVKRIPVWEPIYLLKALVKRYPGFQFTKSFRREYGSWIGILGANKELLNCLWNGTQDYSSDVVYELYITICSLIQFLVSQYCVHFITPNMFIVIRMFIMPHAKMMIVIVSDVMLYTPSMSSVFQTVKLIVLAWICAILE